MTMMLMAALFMQSYLHCNLAGWVQCHRLILATSLTAFFASMVLPSIDLPQSPIKPLPPRPRVCAPSHSLSTLTSARLKSPLKNHNRCSSTVIAGGGRTSRSKFNSSIDEVVCWGQTGNLVILASDRVIVSTGLCSRPAFGSAPYFDSLSSRGPPPGSES